ncbi:MAG: GlsB/YeaQ/YmgE family stress response membrane protein [Clostridia bacterium]
MTLWNIICWLVVGAIIGWIAGLVMKNRGGVIRNIVVGIAGSFLGGWIASMLRLGGASTFSLIGILISVGGACILIALSRFITGRKR